MNSGLEDAYRDIIPQSNLSLPDYVLPASTFVGSGTASIPIRSTGDATRTRLAGPLRYDDVRRRPDDDQGRRHRDVHRGTDDVG